MMQTSLAERLRVLRAQRGLSVAQASEQIGVARHTLRDLELGRREPHYPTLSKIAQGYGVPVEELLEEPVLSEKGEARSKDIVFRAHDFDLEWALSAPEDEFAREIRSPEAWAEDLVPLERALIARFRELKERYPVRPGERWMMPHELYDEFFLIMERANAVQHQIITKRRNPEEAPITPELPREVVDFSRQLAEALV